MASVIGVFGLWYLVDFGSESARCGHRILAADSEGAKLAMRIVALSGRWGTCLHIGVPCIPPKVPTIIASGAWRYDALWKGGPMFFQYGAMGHHASYPMPGKEAIALAIRGDSTSMADKDEPCYVCPIAGYQWPKTDAITSIAHLDGLIMPYHNTRLEACAVMYAPKSSLGFPRPAPDLYQMSL